MSPAAAASTIGQCTSCAIVCIVFLQPRDGRAVLRPLSLACSSGRRLTCAIAIVVFEASQRSGCALPPLVCSPLLSSTGCCLPHLRCLLGLAMEERHSAPSRLQTISIAGGAFALIAPARHGFVPQVRLLVSFCALAAPCPKNHRPRPPSHFCFRGRCCFLPATTLFVSVVSRAVRHLECRGSRGWCQKSFGSAPTRSHRLC